jgi:hypothetical protein
MRLSPGARSGFGYHDSVPFMTLFSYRVLAKALESSLESDLESVKNTFGFVYGSPDKKKRNEKENKGFRDWIPPYNTPIIRWLRSGPSSRESHLNQHAE